MKADISPFVRPSLHQANMYQSHILQKELYLNSNQNHYQSTITRLYTYLKLLMFRIQLAIENSLQSTDA